MSRHQSLLTTKALLTRWDIARGGAPGKRVFTLTRDRWVIRVTFDGDTATGAELLPPGCTAYVDIDMGTVGRWMKCSRDEMALHKVGDRVTVAGRAGTVTGFEIEGLAQVIPGKPWPFRLCVVYDDAVEGRPLPASAAPLDPAPGEPPSCKAWQCKCTGTLMCLTREYGPAGGPLERRELCPFHAQYGDRRLTVVRVLYEIPTPAAAADIENGRTS